MTVDVVGLVTSLSIARIAGMALLAFGLGTLVGLAHRSYVGEKAPAYVPILVGLGAIGLWMNTASALVGVVTTMTGEEPGVLVLRNMETNVVAILLGGVAAIAGARTGDRLTPNVLALTGARQLDTEVSKLVRTVGRLITVTLPGTDDIDDIEGYEPVPAATKGAIGGIELVFPRGLTVDELRTRLIDRLKEDYGVGHVDVEVTAEGTVEYLAVGSRAAGIGATLPPRRAAIAVTGNPAPNASPGDRVHLWERTEEGADRVGPAELRATNGDVATLTLDRGTIDDVDQSTAYDIVTLPAEKRPEQEFAALLRAANETMGSTTVDPGSPLDGIPVGALAPAVVAIRPEEGRLETLPRRSRVVAGGDTLYTVGRHDELRKLEAVARPAGAVGRDR